MASIPHPPVNQPVLTPTGDFTPHWKRWFVDLHKLITDQAARIADLESKTTSG